MKVFASLLLAAAMGVALVRADTCDTASVTALLTSDDVATCASDSGYSPSSLSTPTDAEMEVMCTSTSCQSVLSDLTQMFVEECTVGTFALYADLITPVTTFCSSVSSSTSSSSSVGTNSSALASTAASATSEAASTGSVAAASSASLDNAEEVTVAPIATNTTSSASSDDEVTVGDSDSGSDLAIETQTPTTNSNSASTTTDSTTSASSAADDTSSGSSAGVAVSPSAALLGSALVATAALIL